MIGRACEYYYGLNEHDFESKHAYNFRLSLVKHLFLKKIKNRIDKPHRSDKGKKRSAYKLNLEYFEATILSDVFNEYTLNNPDMAYEDNFNSILISKMNYS